MSFEQRRGTSLQDLHLQLAQVLTDVQLASEWDGKDGEFKGITPDGTVYITQVKHVGDTQHRYKRKIGHISEL